MGPVVAISKGIWFSEVIRKASIAPTEFVSSNRMFISIGKARCASVTSQISPFYKYQKLNCPFVFFHFLSMNYRKCMVWCTEINAWCGVRKEMHDDVNCDIDIFSFDVFMCVEVHPTST